MSGLRLGARRLHELRDELPGRTLALLGSVADHRLLSTQQIERLYFDAADHRSQLAASRACRRTLERCTRERLLVRLDRRIGGIRAGSAAHVYAIGPVGERLLQRNGPRYRHREPSAAFVDHTLAVADQAVEATLLARGNRAELLSLEPEPRCWRRHTLPGGAAAVLRPDLFISVASEELEHRWFVEVDLGSEHLPTLLRKCHAYEAYYQSGQEQTAHGVFPRVLWVMHRAERVERLRAAIAADTRLTNELFVVTTSDRATDVLAGGAA